MVITKIEDHKRLDSFSKELIKRDTELAMLELRIRRLENITIDTEILKRVDNIMDRTFRMSAVYFLSILKLEYPDLYRKSVSSVAPYFSINQGDKLIVSARRAYYYLGKIGKIDEVLKDCKFPIILDEYTLWEMYSKKRVVTNIFKLIRAVKPPQASFFNAVNFDSSHCKLEKEFIDNTNSGNYEEDLDNYSNYCNSLDDDSVKDDFTNKEVAKKKVLVLDKKIMGECD